MTTPVIHDVVLRGGRVVDPESGLDARRDVGIVGSRVTAVSEGALVGRDVVDAAGLVVAPGFIDLHSHAQAVGEARLQALDGVTTALELEAGAAPVAGAYARAAAEGRPVHHGWSTSWAALRRLVVAGIPPAPGDGPLDHLGDDSWRRPATPHQVDVLLGSIEAELADGALGVGILLGYAPAVDPSEIVRVGALAAAADVPVFIHARPLVEQDARVVVDGAEELARLAGETGAHVHHCHVNSTSTRHLDRVQSVLERVRAEGARVTAEVYPYGAGMTAIGSDYFAPDRLHVLGATGTPEDVVYARTGENVGTVQRLLELRAVDPSGLAFIRSFDEDAAPERLAHILALPGAVVASDAVPFTVEPGCALDPMQWPPPDFVRTHPRGVGTFARTLRIGVRETGVLTLADAVHRCTLGPARILEAVAPGMRGKGRVQAGCDADLVVFDPDRVRDHATYAHSTRPSTGFAHVVVGGEFVVRNGVLQTTSFPGRPVRGRP